MCVSHLCPQCLPAPQTQRQGAANSWGLGHSEEGCQSARERVVGSACRLREGVGARADLFKSLVPLKYLLVQGVPHSMTTGNASERLSQLWQQVASPFSPEPGGGHRWAG